ncbi:hypothetical protein LIER_22768 [Lithospermum erythrorhizon]|uniref:Helitron helicase-like domain-containing protein n=2 Tax=Lithospermum erythrorhizon TaxID=34254 RepID=A0AAV3QW99_LITER
MRHRYLNSMTLVQEFVVHVIEFQKQGLPHAHFLIILKPKYKLLTPEAYDRMVCAELPDKNEDPYLYILVVRHMMHGPCGELNPENICIKDERCKNHYPKNFSEHTVHGKEFDCHINVEVCCDIKAVKYLYKYIHKGHDKVMFRIGSDNQGAEIDEISDYQNARWVSPVEAAWRLFAFPLYGMYPSVLQLQVHLPNFQTIQFEDDADLNDIMQSERVKRSMLTEFFSTNFMDK